MTCQTLKGNYLNEFFTKIFDCYNIKRFVGTLKWGYTVCTVNICGQSAVPSVHIELCKTWFFLREAVILHDGIISYCQFMVYDSFSLPVSTTGLLLSPTVQTFFFKLKKSEAIDKKILHQKPIRTRLYTLCQ